MTLLQVEDLHVSFPVRTGSVFRRRTTPLRAVHNVSFTVDAGETLGLVGESGSGKTTTGRSILQLPRPTSGSVRFEGRELTALSGRELRAVRPGLQVVFQDPYGSLDPRLPVGEAIAEPLRVHRRWDGTGPRRVAELLERVGLEPAQANRYPHEFSGGQRQRVALARALALRPKLLILDEPVSALDVSVRAGVVNLLADLQAELGVAYLFIAHDLTLVRHVAHRLAVMYLGKLVEVGSVEALFSAPAHPYTKALLSAVPIADPLREHGRERIALAGEVPSPLDPPSGCPFRTRCWKAQPLCAREEPALVERGQGRPVACHFPEG